MSVSHFAIIFRSDSGSIPMSHRSRSPLRSLFGHENISRCLNEIKWRLILNIYLICRTCRLFTFTWIEHEMETRGRDEVPVPGLAHPCVATNIFLE